MDCWIGISYSLASSMAKKCKYDSDLLDFSKCWRYFPKPESSVQAFSPQPLGIPRKASSVCAHISTLCSTKNIWECRNVAWGGHWENSFRLLHQTTPNSQLFSPGWMLNSDVSAFLRLQRHSPGSTRELKRTSHSQKPKSTIKNIFS